MTDTNSRESFDARDYDPWSHEDRSRDLSADDRDAMVTAAQYRQAYSISNLIMGIGSLLCLVAVATHRIWGPWLGTWGLGR